MGEPRIGVIPGTGVVARHGETILVIGGDAPIPSPLIEQLSHAASGLAGEDRVREVVRLILDVENPPPIAVATLSPEASLVFLYGDIDVTWPGRRVSGSGHVLGVMETVPVDTWFCVAPVANERTDLEAWNDLETGTVPGAGIVVAVETTTATDAAATAVDSEPVAPVEADQTGPTDAVAVVESEPVAALADQPEPTSPVAAIPTGPADQKGESGSVGVSEGGAGDSGASFESILLTDGVDLSDREPLAVGDEELAEPEERQRPAYEQPVEVLGVFSPRGYFNHPDARYCSRTGVKMGASRTSVLARGPRPPLGVVTLDDGVTFTVQWSAVIGRDPATHERVVQETAAPLVLTDAEQSISRHHALLDVIDWDVLITDLESSNGTYVQLDPNQPPRRLSSGERVVLRSGAVVWIGSRSFVYSEHHVR